MRKRHTAFSIFTVMLATTVIVFCGAGGTITVKDAVSSVSLSASKTSPQALADAGTIVFTAQASQSSGSSGAYEYKFRVRH